MQSEILDRLKQKRGATITGLFLETYLFQGQDTSKAFGALLQEVGLLITFSDGDSLWLHSASPDGQSLKLTIDDELTPIPHNQTVLVDLGEELGKSVLMDVSAEVGYRDFIGTYP